MIIRTLPLRRGRHALPRNTSFSRSWRRCLASNTEQLNPHFDASNVPKAALEAHKRSSRPRHALLKPEDIRDPDHPVAREYLFLQHQRERTDHIGTVQTPHYKPHELLSNPPRPADITLELLLASQAHIGHATSLWHPGNAKYIHGIRGGAEDPIHIISLDVTAAYLRRACTVVRGVAERGGLILFVGTRADQARAVVRAAQLAGGCHLFTKWIAGSITNGQQILGRCRKKVVDQEDREIRGFQDQLVLSPVVKPDLVVCLNPLENYVLLHECGLHNVPTIGIVDTDVNPTWMTYPIPANDDSLRCVQVIAGVLGRAGEEGQRARLARAKNGEIMAQSKHTLRRPTPGQAEKEREAEELARRARQQEEEIQAQEPAQDDIWQAEQEGGETELVAAADGGENELHEEVSTLDSIDASLLMEYPPAENEADAGAVDAAPTGSDRPL